MYNQIAFQRSHIKFNLQTNSYIRKAFHQLNWQICDFCIIRKKTYHNPKFNLIHLI